MNNSRTAWFRHCVPTLIALLLSAGLSACGASCDEDLRTVGVVASGQYSKSRDAQDRLAYNAWGKNTWLEKFLEEELEKDNAETLMAKHGFQCSPSPVQGNCTECRSCDRTTPVLFNSARYGVTHCIDSGPMLVHVEFGPSKTVSAMTYWKK